MNPQTYLSVLTILGLMVGLIGGLISQLTKTSAEVNGTTRKRLTSSGRWALAISLLGFAGSFSSELLKSSMAAQQRTQAAFEKKLEEERQRQDDLWKTRSDELAGKIFEKTTSALNTSEANLGKTIEGFENEQQAILKTRLDIAANGQKVLSDNLLRESRLTQNITASGQQLNTLALSWSFAHVPPKFSKLVKGAQTQVDERIVDEGINDPSAAKLVEPYLSRHAMVYPWLNVLGDDEWSAKPVLMLVYLDEASSAVLPLGRISYDDKAKNIAAAVEFVEDETNFQRPDWPIKRGRDVRFNAALGNNGDQFNLSWSFPLGSLGKSIDRESDEALVKASLPNKIRIIILSSIDYFPCPARDNLAKCKLGYTNDPLFDSVNGLEPGFRQHSILVLQPNDLFGYVATYDMSFTGRQHVGTTEPWSVDARAAVFEGTRIDNDRIARIH